MQKNVHRSHWSFFQYRYTNYHQYTNLIHIQAPYKNVMNSGDWFPPRKMMPIRLELHMAHASWNHLEKLENKKKRNASLPPLQTVVNSHSLIILLQEHYFKYLSSKFGIKFVLLPENPVVWFSMKGRDRWMMGHLQYKTRQSISKWTCTKPTQHLQIWSEL